MVAVDVLVRVELVVLLVKVQDCDVVVMTDVEVVEVASLCHKQIHKIGRKQADLSPNVTESQLVKTSCLTRVTSDDDGGISIQVNCS